MSTLRDDHPVLNFYTTDQLVLLAEKLAGVVQMDEELSVDELSVEASMLLNLIARGIYVLPIGIKHEGSHFCVQIRSSSILFLKIVR